MRKVLVTEHREELPERFSRELYVVPKAAPAKEAEAAATAPSLVKNMALFLVSPFVGLAYALLLPFVGVAMLAWMVCRALYERPVFRRAVRWCGFAAKVAAAPLVGLAYLVLFPFVGAAMLIWVGAREAAGGRHAAMAG
jgi:hypothetical protein